MTSTEYRTKVNWLSRAFYLDKKISNLTQKIDFLKSTAAGTCIKTNPGGFSGGFDSSKMEAKVVTYVDLENQCKDFQQELVATRREISKVVYNVENPVFFSLLMSRYLDYKTWEDISEILNLSSENKYIFQVHRRAVSYVQIPKETA